MFSSTGSIAAIDNISTTEGSISTTNGNIFTTNGNIWGTDITGAAGTFSWIACTGTSGRPLTPTAQGVYIGSASIGSTAIELCATGNQHIDFTTPNVEFQGRELYDVASAGMRWYVNGNTTLRVMLKQR